ncbi:MAG: iron-sulfur cluster repair di-iron protein, ric [Clostridiales bacterium]|nr:iron-sulfur cluster repair di-iron protein, ric [Clostridiales bacterium]
MSKSFDEIKERHLKTLQQFVPIVDRVHGKHHPEFHDVRKLFEAIAAKIKDAGTDRPELNEEFERLRAVTGNYAVPGDVCESYESVYKMLRDLDEAYRE